MNFNFDRYENFLSRWALLGVFVLVCGSLFLPSYKIYHQLMIFTLWVPGLIALVFCRGNFSVWRTPEILTFSLFSCWTIVSVVSQPVMAGAEKIKLPFYVFMTVLGLLLASQCRPDRLIKLLVLSGFLGGVAAGLSWVIFVHKLGRFSLLDKLTTLGLWDTAIMSAHGAGALMLIGYFLLPAERMRRWWWVAAGLVALGYALFLISNSTRGVWVALFVTILLMSFIARDRVLRLTGLVSAIAGGLLIWSTPIILQRGVSGRPALWQGGLDLIFQNPWFGLGFKDILLYEPTLQMYLKHPHNLFLNVGVHTGVVGLLLWCALWLVVGWRAWCCREQPLGRMLLALWIFASIAFQTDGIGPWLKPNADWLITWLLLAISLVLAAVKVTPSESRGVE